MCVAWVHGNTVQCLAWSVVWAQQQAIWTCLRVQFIAGSMNMSYDSSNLTTPDIKWLGVRPSDLDRFNIPEQCRLPMTEEDIKTGKRLVRLLSLFQALVH